MMIPTTESRGPVDYLVGIEDGHLVRVPSGVSSAGPGLASAGPVGATTSGQLVLPDGSVAALTEACYEVLANPTATTTVLTGAGEYFAYRCTVAVGNITVYDSLTASGKVLVQTQPVALGTHPIFGAGVDKSLEVTNGVTIVLSGAATVYAVLPTV